MLLAVCPKLRIFYVASSFSTTQNGGENKTKKKKPWQILYVQELLFSSQKIYISYCELSYKQNHLEFFQMCVKVEQERRHSVFTPEVGKWSVAESVPLKGVSGIRSTQISRFQSCHSLLPLRCPFSVAVPSR